MAGAKPECCTGHRGTNSLPSLEAALCSAVALSLGFIF